MKAQKPIKAFCCNIDMVSYLSSMRRHCLSENYCLQKISLGAGESIFLWDFPSFDMIVGGINTLTVNSDDGLEVTCIPHYSALAPGPQTPAARALISC